MTGQVVVAGSPLPPQIGITNPLSGTGYAAPANVTIQAGAINEGGFVTNVQFLSGATLIASENSGPFAATVNGLTAGAYTLSAIALDNNGMAATNTVAVSVVNPLPLLLGGVSKPSGTGFQLSYPANTGLNYVVQRSSDFMLWVPIATNMAESNPVVFMDINATNNLNFYRVGLLPNP